MKTARVLLVILILAGAALACIGGGGGTGGGSEGGGVTGENQTATFGAEEYHAQLTAISRGEP